MYPLTVRCSFKLMMQGQTHSMSLRSSVIRTPLLGGDGDLMAGVIAAASVERPYREVVCGLRERVCVRWGGSVVTWL